MLPEVSRRQFYGRSYHKSPRTNPLRCVFSLNFYFSPTGRRGLAIEWHHTGKYSSLFHRSSNGIGFGDGTQVSTFGSYKFAENTHPFINNSTLFRYRAQFILETQFTTCYLLDLLFVLVKTTLTSNLNFHFLRTDTADLSVVG